MLRDLKRLNQKDFMKKYGHLRPGTYDIMSKRYDQLKGISILTKISLKKQLILSYVVKKCKN